MLLAFDDTDSTLGGCTTHTAYELVRRLEGVDLIGPPRLVRLNPNVPHKTRGNGAVLLRLGHGRGRKVPIGMAPERDLFAFQEGEELEAEEADRAFEAAQRLIQASARLEDPKTSPGLVMSSSPLDSALYWNAVRRYVGRAEADDALSAAGARFCGWKSGRGILGAAAAAAWPGDHGTLEWIAYRHEAHRGTPRRLDPGIGPWLDASCPSTFDNWDAARSYLRIAPASPCPVLAGVRGLDAGDLARGLAALGPERPEGSLLFATNQATDDHVQDQPASGLRPLMGARVTARVAARPRSMRGGHVFVRVADESGAIDLAAFEPTKEFRDGVRGLHVGDHVVAAGSTGEDPTLLSLEKLERSTGDVASVASRCGDCGRALRSRGRGERRVCSACGPRSPRITVAAGTGAREAWEVPTSVRRHLARPLRLTRLIQPVVA